MKSQKKQIILMVFLGVSILLIFTKSISPVIYFNRSDKGFGDGKESTGLKDYVIQGAAYFLNSYSDFLLFLRDIEVAEPEDLGYNELMVNLNNGIGNLEHARDVYATLKQEADVTPYNPIIINELLNFNYNGFQKKNQLLQPIFDQVRDYLSKGKIREMYGEALSQTEDVLNIAYKIRERIEINEFPEVSSLWDLNQSCSKLLLFGQYAARIFQELCD